MAETPRFFDANCMVGRYKRFRPGSFYTTERLLEEMAHYGISEALVVHALSRENHPSSGNPAVLKEVDGRPNLHPAWSALPPRSEELRKPHDFVIEALNNGVRAIRLFTAQYFFTLSEWCVGKLLDELEEHRIPTFIDPDPEYAEYTSDRFDWDAIDRLCTDHPGLRVILSAARFRTSNRLLYQLMEKHNDIYIELSGYWFYRGIEFICREFGANRLIFGTRMPLRDPASTLAMVNYAEISEEEKHLIAGDNLRRLLKGAMG